MLKLKQSQQDKQSAEEHLDKIVELKIELDNVAKEVSKARGELDLAINSKKQADLEKQAVLTQTEMLKEHLVELEQLILAKSKELTDLTRAIAENVFTGDKAVHKKVMIIESLNKEISKLGKIVKDFGDLRTDYTKLKELNNSEKLLNRQLTKENADLKQQIEEKKKMQMQDLPYWKRLRSDAEHLFLNASAKEEFVKMATEQLKLFCEENDIPFDINFKI